MPLVFKAYFYISNETQLSAASASLNVTYVDGTTEEGASTLDFYNISKDHWMQDIVAVYPTQVITDVRVSARCRI